MMLASTTMLLLVTALGDKPALPELREGIYALTAPGGRGTVQLTRGEGEHWWMVSVTGTAVLQGVGLVQDGSISFALTDGKGVLLAIYRIGAGGKLYGRYTGKDGAVHEEVLELLREFK